MTVQIMQSHKTSRSSITNRVPINEIGKTSSNLSRQKKPLKLSINKLNKMKTFFIDWSTITRQIIAAGYQEEHNKLRWRELEFLIITGVNLGYPKYIEKQFQCDSPNSPHICQNHFKEKGLGIPTIQDWLKCDSLIKFQRNQLKIHSKILLYHLSNILLWSK